MSKLRLRKIKELAHRHTARVCQIQGFNQRLMASKVLILSVLPCFLFETLRTQRTKRN